MKKKILITGATDGIGLETVKMLAPHGHHLLLHGRNASKLKNTVAAVTAISANIFVESYVADLSRLADVEALAVSIADKHESLDVLINNAGVYKTPNPIAEDGLDIRFVVNTVAPYLLTRRLLPILESSGRVVNLSSAAQSPVSLEAFAGRGSRLSDANAYAQSKLALTMWSRDLALELKSEGPAIIAVNPGSLLASKMVKEAYGVGGNDIQIGADILCRAALNDEFAHATGQYFDNDQGRFGSPHRDALDPQRTKEIVRAIEQIIDAQSVFS